MMRAIWKGAVSFGLVNVPVRLFAATEEHDIRFHQVHREDGGRIRYKRTCDVCSEEVGYGDIAKGYESSDGQLVTLTDDDLDQLPVATSREIDVVEFVPSEQVDPILFAKTYYLEPDARAAKPYALLREALLQTDRMAVVKVALRQKEALAVLRVRDKAIVLQTMLWPDEVREADFEVLNNEVELRPQELSMASSLVESMTADFHPEQFIDEYRGAMQELIEAKLDSGDATEAPAQSSRPAATSGGEVIDLLTALQRSVDKARGGSAADGQTAPDDAESAVDAAPAAAPATEPATEAPATRTPAKKVPATNARASKAAPTKAPAKKAPVKKVPATKAATPAKKTAAKAPAGKQSAKPAGRERSA